MSDNQRERIINRALSMYIDQGVKSVRMDDIARDLHISKRTIYEIFGDKEELLYQSIMAYIEKMTIEMDNVGEQAPNILISILMVSKYITQNSEKTWRLRRSLREYYPKIHERINAIDNKERLRIFRERLLTGVEQGLISSVMGVDILISIMHYVCTAIVEQDDRFVIPEGLTREQAFSSTQITILRGVSTPKGMEVIDEYLKENIKI
ncbi:MAG: TetR/AcrR family transcriptional regulator [Rikenellaceae bacterium]